MCVGQRPVPGPGTAVEGEVASLRTAAATSANAVEEKREAWRTLDDDVVLKARLAAPEEEARQLRGAQAARLRREATATAPDAPAAGTIDSKV